MGSKYEIQYIFIKKPIEKMYVSRNQISILCKV